MSNLENERGERMKNWLIRFFGFTGSWKWACKQMDKGLIIRPRNAVSTKYRLDQENQRRIQWAHTHNDDETTEWSNAFIFLSDFENIRWAIWHPSEGRIERELS